MERGALICAGQPAQLEREGKDWRSIPYIVQGLNGPQCECKLFSESSRPPLPRPTTSNQQPLSYLLVPHGKNVSTDRTTHNTRVMQRKKAALLTHPIVKEGLSSSHSPCDSNLLFCVPFTAGLPFLTILGRISPRIRGVWREGRESGSPSRPRLPNSGRAVTSCSTETRERYPGRGLPVHGRSGFA